MESSNFIRQYLKNPRTVGALAPSSEKLAYKMVEGINFLNASCIVEYGPAENLKEYLNKYNIDKVDYIVSGLPFASLHADMSRKILTVTRETLKDEGEFITFQYTLFKIRLFKSYFSKIKRKKVFLNLPPAHVFKCENK